MKIKRQNKYALAKIKQLPKKVGTSSRILSQRISDPIKNSDFQFSFDSFFYQDHVTLKKYSMDNLKNNSALKFPEMEESINEKWREEERSKMVKLIEYIDLWKNIKSNRNNILVYGNKKNIDTLPTQKRIQWNLDKDENSIISSTAFGTERCNTLENPLAPSRPSHVGSEISREERRSKEMEILNSESLGKIKRKMNFQIYKLNKELLRDYLHQNKQYDTSFNSLMKNQDNLQSKLKKITTLIDALKKQKNLKGKSSNRLSQKTLKNIYDTTFELEQRTRQIANSANLKTIQTLRAQTQMNEPQQTQFSKCEISLKKLRETCKRIEGADENAPRRKFQAPPVIRKKLNVELSKKEIEDTKIEKAFEKEWENMNEQIKLKFRREAEFSLCMSKKKKKEKKTVTFN